MQIHYLVGLHTVGVNYANTLFRSFSAGRKREVVMRLLRGEDLESTSAHHFFALLFCNGFATRSGNGCHWGTRLC